MAFAFAVGIGTRVGNVRTEPHTSSVIGTISTPETNYNFDGSWSGNREPVTGVAFQLNSPQLQKVSLQYETVSRFHNSERGNDLSYAGVREESRRKDDYLSGVRFWLEGEDAGQYQIDYGVRFENGMTVNGSAGHWAGGDGMDQRITGLRIEVRKK